MKHSRPHWMLPLASASRRTATTSPCERCWIDYGGELSLTNVGPHPHGRFAKVSDRRMGQSCFPAGGYRAKVFCCGQYLDGHELELRSSVDLSLVQLFWNFEVWDAIVCAETWVVPVRSLAPFATGTILAQLQVPYLFSAGRTSAGGVIRRGAGILPRGWPRTCGTRACSFSRTRRSSIGSASEFKATRTLYIMCVFLVLLSYVLCLPYRVRAAHSA